ncbi:MAG: glycosyltransferase family 4 protein [Chitinophagales bacterium]|nr:glycosyltransferase family 4 protein [Chitinophagales bacterium]
MRKVLIITYYWPPSGGAGVQRWLKFVKYLPSFGWQPVVYTVANGEYPVIDASLENEIPKDVEVIKKKIWEPYALYKFIYRKEKEDRITPNTGLSSGKSSKSQLAAAWIRGNLLIPDPRKFWIRPSVKFLTDYLKKNPVDAIITSSPPHSLQLIGLTLKKKTGLPWIVDFRDPWSSYYFLLNLQLNKRVMDKHRALEKKVLDTADRVIVVSPSMKENMEKIVPGKISVITNGYDEEDFLGIAEERTGNKFSMVYTGTFLPTQNPNILWEALAELTTEFPKLKDDLEIKLVGIIDPLILSDITKHQLDRFLVLQNYVPHNEVIKIQKAASVLLLSVNNTPTAREIITGKLFEYLGSGRPILCFAPKDGDAGKIVLDAKAGVVNDYYNKEALKQQLVHLYAKYRAGTLSIQSSGIEKYSRRKLTEELSILLRETTTSGN